MKFFLLDWLVGFNGISTSVGYLMPEPFYTYIIYMICKCIIIILHGWIKILKVIGLVWFHCLIAYQSFWVFNAKAILIEEQ